MAQKIIDIRHPHTKKEEKETSPRKKKWFLPLLLVAVVIFFGWYFKSYHVEVRIWPDTEQFTFSDIVDVHAFSEKDIAVQAFEETVKGKDDFEVLGTSLVEQKTKGVISVCQDYGDSGQPIREGTRFVSEKGKTFLGDEAFTVPGRTYEGGEVVPGCVDVPVTAAESGEDYNVSSSTKFSLPGLQGTALYGRFSGESFTITREGKKEEVSYLTSEEISKGEEILLDKLFEKGKENLRQRLEADFLLDNRGQYNYRVIERSVPSEGEKSSFEVEMEIRVEVIALRAGSMEEFLQGSLPEGFVWHEKSFNYDFLRSNFEEKSGEVEVSLDAQIYRDIDIEKIKRDIAGLKFSEALDLLEEEVSNVSLYFRPLGPSSVPNNVDRIEVELLFDKN